MKTFYPLVHLKWEGILAAKLIKISFTSHYSNMNLLMVANK